MKICLELVGKKGHSTLPLRVRGELDFDMVAAFFEEKGLGESFFDEGIGVPLQLFLDDRYGQEAEGLQLQTDVHDFGDAFFQGFYLEWVGLGLGVGH